MDTFNLNILYFEDSTEDALMFANILMNALPNGFPISSQPEHNQLRLFFANYHIDWVVSADEYLSKLNRISNNYSLFLLDMKDSSRDGICGWELIRHTRFIQSEQNKPAEIWILSTYSVLSFQLDKIYGVHHFFSKDKNGYCQLKNHLLERFTPSYMQEVMDTSLTFQSKRHDTNVFEVSQIVCIIKITGNTYIYYLKQGDLIARKANFYDAPVLEEAIRQITEHNILQLIQISAKCIINAEYIEHIYGHGKKYYIKMRIQGSFHDFPISYSYLDNVKSVLGDPLPTMSQE